MSTTASAAPSDTWRCNVCKKVKDLKGPHLTGKNTVRSDCWPCAKKQTFTRESTGSNAAVSPQQQQQQKSTDIFRDVFAKPNAAASAPPNPFASVFSKPEEAKAANATGQTTSTTTTAATKSPSPPPPTAAGAAASAAEWSPKDSDVWRCTVCKKVKDLKGPHLNGKLSVRSDCWPCAMKRVFARERADGARVEVTASKSATSTTGAMPASLSAIPSTEAQAAAFQNIFAAAKAAAAKVTTATTTTMTSTGAAATTSPPAFSSSMTAREGSTGATAGGGSTTAAPAPFGMPRTQSNPFLTPAVSAASIKKFQTSYASVMSSSSTSAKHEDPAVGAAAGSAVDAGKMATPSTSTSTTTTNTAGAFTPSTTSPYVMESATGTSPPFTFRPNANYTPAAGSAWSTSALLPGSTASLSAPAGRTMSPFSAPPVMSGTASTAAMSGGRSDMNALNTSATPAAGGAGKAFGAGLSRPSPSTSALATPEAAATATAASSASANASEGSNGVWMCEHCHKTKDLKGDHLRGKTTVRSDCWPCAKKRTFVLTTPGEMAAAGRSIKLGAGGSGTRSSSAILKTPNATSHHNHHSHGHSHSHTNNTNQSESTRTSSQVASGILSGANSAAAAVAAAVAPSAPAIANPFRTVKSSFLSPASVAVSGQTPLSADATFAVPPFAWTPAAIPESAEAEEAVLLHPETALTSAGSGRSASGAGVPAAAAAATLPVPLTVGIASAGNISGAAGFSHSPSSSSFFAAMAADEATFYAAMARFDQQLLKSFRERLVNGVQLRAVWHGRVLYVITQDEPEDGCGSAAATTAATRKEGGGGGGAGLVGSATVAQSDEPSDLVGAFAELGRYAALYLAVEQKLAGSRFRHIGRLFCPDEFAFAAACCYANNFFAGETAAAAAAAAAATSPSWGSQSTACPRPGEGAATPSSPSSSSSSTFKVYGPQTDPTKSLSLWGRIVSQSAVANLCVVSEEQRVVAAQTLYRRVSWLAAPHAMTATAIQLSVEGEATADVHGVDVVLLTGTMKLEELPQAVPLAQLSQTFT